MSMKVSVLLLVLLTLQSRAEDDSIMGIISKLVNKMEQKYPSGDILAGHIDEFKAHEESDSERDQSLLDVVSGQAAEIENVIQSLEDAEEENAANRETDNDQVNSLQQQVSDNGGQIAGLLSAIGDAQQETETKMLDQLNSQVDALKQGDAALGGQVEELQTAMQSQIDVLTSEKESMQSEIEEYKLRVAELENRSGGGSSQSSSFLWIISNYQRNKRNRKKLTSTTFYSSTMGGQQFGYKMQVYAYLHNKGHLSLFFKLLRGTYDDIQEWPFPYHVQFELLPQRADVSIMRNTTSISDEERANNPDVFGRPSRSNTGWGFTQFIEEKQVEAKYLDHDKIYVKVTVV